MEPIIKNPRTIKELAYEIIKVCDAYWGREMEEQEAKDFIKFWSENENKKLFKGPELNSTVKIIIGKRREELVLKWLKKTQSK